MFKECGFVNIDYLVRNRLETDPSKILNILNRDWRKWIKPAGMLDGGGLDPNFGYETQAANATSIENQFYGSVFTITEAGTGDNITAYIVCSIAEKSMKAAVYLHSDSSLVKSTDKVTVPVGSGWITFPFSSPKPSFTANTAYCLEVWSQSASGVAYAYWNTGTTDQGHYAMVGYNNWPNPAEFSHADREYSIYCTYTAAAVGIASKRLLVGVGL